ncbi:hypothetical protein NL676_039408 [Syzygium grande]|nr:hypothetical protein NL676_039408 [Syzygium grande]
MCGQMDNARRLFDDMPQRNNFTRKTTIEGYTRMGEAAKTLDLLVTFRTGDPWKPFGCVKDMNSDPFERWVQE